MIPMIHNYTSNITRKQFELIREDLENARKNDAPTHSRFIRSILWRTVPAHNRLPMAQSTK